LFELRALRDLARIDASQSRETVAKALREVVGWFPEALDIPDLQEARYVMEQQSK
jgi:hypothetical protein